MKKYTGNLYYIPQRNFWRLKEHTNIFQQWDNRKELQFELAGYTERVTFKKPDGIIRVICLGTSSTAGWYNQKENSYPFLLQKKLDNHYGKGRFEVVNAGVGGYVSYQLLIFLKEVLLKLSPDIVILYLGSNDISYFGGITAREYYARAKLLSAHLKNEEQKNKIFKYGIQGTYPFYPLIAESRLLGYLYFKFLNWYQKSKFSRQILRCPPADQEYVLREFVRLHKKYNFKLIFSPEVEYYRETGYVRLSPYYNLMKKIAQEENIIFVDLLPKFINYPPQEVFYDYVHPTNFGHQIIAETFFKIVKNLEIKK